MNKKLKQSLEDQARKKLLKEKIRSSKRKLDEQNLYATFVEPFTDILDALKISSKEIVSNLMMVTGQILALSPEKQEERMRNYAQRQKKIEDQWKPLMDKADAALGSGDADIVALALAPGVYVASALGASAYNSAEGVGSYLDDLGLKKGFLSLLPGVSDSTDVAPAPKKDDSGTSLLDKLNTLFLGTAIGGSVIGALIKDRKDKKKESKSFKGNVLSENKSEFIKDMRKYMDETGLSSQFEEMSKDIVAMFEDILEDFDKVYESKKKIIDAIVESKDIEELKTTLDKLKTKETAKSVEDIFDSLEENKKKLMTDESFLNALEEKSDDDSEIDPEEAAQNTVFIELVDATKKSMETTLSDLRSELGKDLQKLLPSDKTLETIKKTKVGLKLFNMIRDAKSRYNIT